MHKSKTPSKSYPISSPINYCNQFLLIHLQKMKKASQRGHFDQKSTVYNIAMNSIRKYPLPIICESQLKSLQGIGDFLCNQLIRVIKKHYGQFLKKDHETGQFEEIMTNKTQAEIQVNNSEIHSIYQRSSQDSRSLNTAPLIDSENDDSKSVKSAILLKPYKPRINTPAAYFLMAIEKCKSEAVTRPIIKDLLQNQYQLTNLKGFSSIQNNLIKHEFILAYGDELQLLQLTEKGKELLQSFTQKSKIKDSQFKIQHMIHSFKSNSQASCDVSENKSKTNFIEKRTLTSFENERLCLLVDCREMKDKSEQNYFSERLTQRYEIYCRNVNLPVGDFAWTYNGEVLDYIVERKTADDLASSIQDGRYKEQKYRLTNCGIDNIYYLYEGHPSKNSSKSQKDLNQALMTTRVQNNFKIVQTPNINDSIKFLSFLHQQILNKLSNSHIKSVGSFQRFTELNAKSKQLTVEQLFGLSLKTIPGVGKSAVNELVRYFKSFKNLHSELEKLESRVERIQFLKGLFKGSGMRMNLPQLLADFLFADSYK